MRYFDYSRVAKAAKIPARALARLRAIVRTEFPDDDMLFELHLLRLCTAIRDGQLTLDEALNRDGEVAA